MFVKEKTRPFLEAMGVQPRLGKTRFGLDWPDDLRRDVDAYLASRRATRNN
jgi:hypothetical protein